jgi:hypothetical protein
MFEKIHPKENNKMKFNFTTLMMGLVILMAVVLCAIPAKAVGSCCTTCGLPGAFVDISTGLQNPVFTANSGNCPNMWICSGSPAPGFASYIPSSAQYPRGPLFPMAYSPTVFGGSGVIRQLTSLTWQGGTTYALNLITGLPLKEPNGTTTVAGWPQAPNGAARLYLTMGTGFGQVAAFDLPSPTAGNLRSTPIFVTLPTNSPAVGQKIGVMIYVSAPSGYSANFAILNGTCSIPLG